MIYFSCLITYNEIVYLDKQLDDTVYCLYDSQIINYYYGVIVESEFEKFLNACSVQVLQHLEYFDRDEFEHFIQSDKVSYYRGNKDLISTSSG